MTRAHYQSFVKDNLVVIFGHVLIYVKGVLIIPIIIKSVGATVYGGFVLMTSILGIVFGLSSLGTGFRAMRFMPSAKTVEDRGRLFYPQLYFNMFVIMILSGLVVFLEEPLNALLFKNEVSFSIWVIPLYLVSYFLYSQGTSYFRYTSRIHYMMLGGLCFPYVHIGIVLLYLFIFKSINVDVLIMSMAFSAIITAIPFFRIILKEIGPKISLYKPGTFAEDIKLGFPLILNFVFDFILAGSDRYFIAFYLTVTQVGVYTPAYVLGSLIIFVPKAMSTVLPQLMSKAVDNGEDYEARRMLNYAIKIFILLAVPFTFGCIVLGKPTLVLLANKEIAESAYWVTPLISLATLFYGLNILFSNVLFVRLRTTAMFKANVLAGIFNLVANTVLLYFFKAIIVAAITTLASYVTASIYIGLVLKRENWRIDLQPLVVLKALAASLVMSLLLVLISPAGGDVSMTVLAGQVVLGIACYVVMLIVLRTFNRKEIQFAMGYFSH